MTREGGKPVRTEELDDRVEGCGVLGTVVLIEHCQSGPNTFDEIGVEGGRVVEELGQGYRIAATGSRQHLDRVTRTEETRDAVASDDSQANGIHGRALSSSVDCGTP
jgi:hypothetical protein